MYCGLLGNAVFRKYIQPTTPVDSRILDKINTNTITQAQVQSAILSDATPFPGADIAIILARLTGTITTGTYTFPNPGVKQNVIVLMAANQDVNVELNMVGLTQNTIVREYLSDTFHEQISQKTFPTDYDTGTKTILFSHKQLNTPYVIALQSSAPEGGDVGIPWVVRTIPRG